MVTCYISSECVAAFLETQEEGHISQLVRGCLRNAGYEPWEKIEAEMFSVESRLLLIARPCPPKTMRLFGTFPRLERRG